MTGTRRTLVKLLAVVTVAAVLLAGLLSVMRNSPDGDTATWTARFRVVSGLRPGDDVRVAGVKVGRVEEVEVVDNSQALVTFSLEQDQAVYAGTRVSLRYQNLLGQRYLSLTLPDRRGERLEAGSEIGLSRTDPGFDLTALLNGFEPLFAVVEPEEVNTLARNIVAVLQDEAGTVESLLDRTARLTSFVADRDRLITQVLQNLTPVLQNLAAQSDRLDRTVVQLRRLMQGLASQRDVFAGAIDRLGGLVDTTSDLLTEIRPELRTDVTTLRRTLQLVLREEDRLVHTLQVLPTGLGALARTMSYGAWLNVYLCNLGVVPAEGGQPVWLGGSGGPYSEGCR